MGLPEGLRGKDRAARPAVVASAAERTRAAVAAWTLPAGIAIATTAAFVAVSIWWLTQDTAVPYGDAAEHLGTVFDFHDELRAGDLSGVLGYDSFYPPLTRLLGALSVFVGGRNVQTPILAQNLVYVPLLALGCYRTGALLYGSTAGALAVVFALGAPLIAEQFHVFMLDAPLAALVALCVWLVLASDRFRRVDLAIAAGVVAGIGCASKQQFPLYLAVLCIIVVARGGGWRNRRGIVLFLLCTVAIGAPWYLIHLDELDRLGDAALAGPTVPLLASPPLISLNNLGWYFWSVLNGLLFVPLFLFALVGTVVAAVRVTRRPGPADLTPELLGGLLGAWVAISVMPHHDMRYSMPLIVYLAVLGTAWIVGLGGRARVVAVAALGFAVVATTAGASFGVGAQRDDEPLLPGNRFAPRGEGVPPTGTAIVYSNRNFLVSGPRRVGDVPALFAGLADAGVTDVIWYVDQTHDSSPDFSHNGLVALNRMAGLRVPRRAIPFERLRAHHATLIRGSQFESGQPCVRLGDGSGVWVRLGNPEGPERRNFCPLREPRFYAP